MDSGSMSHNSYCPSLSLSLSLLVVPAQFVLPQHALLINNRDHSGALRCDVHCGVALLPKPNFHLSIVSMIVFNRLGVFPFDSVIIVLDFVGD